MTHKVELGDEVKCRVTGYKGIATCRTTYLQGCDRVGVLPEMGKDGKHPETYHIDVGQLDIIAKGKALPKQNTKYEKTEKVGGASSRYI